MPNPITQSAADFIKKVDDTRKRSSDLMLSEATPDHSPFLARAILSASRSQLERGPFDIALGLETEDLLDILEYMSLSDLIGNCHFSKFFVADVSGEPVGALSACDPGENGLMPLGAALSDAYTALGHDEEKLPSVLQRIEAVHRCLPPAQPATWIVEWVAVEKAHRARELLAISCGRPSPRAPNAHCFALRSQLMSVTKRRSALTQRPVFCQP